MSNSELFLADGKTLYRAVTRKTHVNADVLLNRLGEPLPLHPIMPEAFLVQPEALKPRRGRMEQVSGHCVEWPPGDYAQNCGLNSVCAIAGLNPTQVRDLANLAVQNAKLCGLQPEDLAPLNIKFAPMEPHDDANENCIKLAQECHYEITGVPLSEEISLQMKNHLNWVAIQLSRIASLEWYDKKVFKK